MIYSLLIIIIAALLYLLATANMSARERPLLWLAFFLTIAASAAHYYVISVVYGYGDMIFFHGEGLAYAEELRRDPDLFNQLVLAVFQRPHDFPLHIIADGSSTATMSALAGLSNYLFDDSLIIACLWISMFSLSGQLAFYKVFREHTPREIHIRVLFAAMLVPSVLFWGSGFLKEALGIAGLGWCFWGLHLFIERTSPLRAAIWFVPGLILIFISKPYIMIPLAISGGVWFYMQKSIATKGAARLLAQPIYIAVGLGVIVIGLIVLGQIFPAYSLDTFAEEAARRQAIGQEFTGGSTYALGAPAELGVAGQIAIAPLAIMSSLLRPFIFEARSPLVLVNALEMLGVTILLVLAIRRAGLRGLYSTLLQRPMVMAAAVFVIFFALAVGLTTTNLGTLSRYRMPMFPLYVMIIVVLQSQSLRRGQVREALDAADTPASPGRIERRSPLRWRRPQRVLLERRRVEKTRRAGPVERRAAGLAPKQPTSDRKDAAEVRQAARLNARYGNRRRSGRPRRASNGSGARNRDRED